MRNSRGRVQRQGQIYRFSINGMDYAAFIWQLGTRFRGRIEEFASTTNEGATISKALLFRSQELGG